jgi:leucyl-tRNA synthetase
MMIFVNQAEKSGLSQDSYLTFIKLLAPFAPHLTEEIWSELGHTASVHQAVYPVADPAFLKDDTVTLGVQINGKLRGSITLSSTSSEDAATTLAKENEAIGNHLKDKTITKVIYVPGKILSFLVS